MKESDILVPQIVQPFRKHAMESYPNECCAFVTDKLEYVPMENSSPHPEVSGWVKPQDRLAFIQKYGNPLAILHSHPDGPNCPSKADMMSQIANAVPYGIISATATSTLQPFMWGDQLERAPLEGRPYRYGVHDCYSLVRDYYHVKNIETPNVPRDWEWWKNGENLFLDLFAEAKFREVSQCDLMPGDSVLFMVNSKVPNHIGIYLGDGQMLHHMTSMVSPQWDLRKLSKRDPIDRWMKYSTHYLRYAG